MNEQLTGNKRYRVVTRGIFKRDTYVILQVEVRWSDGPDDWQGMPTYLRGSGWRDAKAEDLQYL